MGQYIRFDNYRGIPIIVLQNSGEFCAHIRGHNKFISKSCASVKKNIDKYKERKFKPVQVYIDGFMADEPFELVNITNIVDNEYHITHANKKRDTLSIGGNQDLFKATKKNRALMDRIIKRREELIIETHKFNKLCKKLVKVKIEPRYHWDNK